MRLLCIDPGIVSVGLFGAVLDASGCHILEVTTCTNVDMTTAKGGLHAQICKFMDAWAPTLDTADRLILERQPFQSAGFPLELMLRERYLPKCVFISPNTLHKHFGSAGYTYDGRKARAVQYMTSALQNWGSGGVPGCADALARLATFERKHDCCDAGLLLVYFVEDSRRQVPAPTPAPALPDPSQDFVAFIQQFAYAPPVKSPYF